MTDAPRILLVDDDLVDRLTTRRLLKRAKLDRALEEAETGGAALNAMAGNRFDCVILDYYLPGHDGDNIIRTARERGVTMPILVLTGRGDDDLAVSVMKAGASDYLPKDGLDATRLATSIKALIERSRDEAKGRIQEATIEALTASMASATGAEFFDTVTHRLGEATRCEAAIAAQTTGDGTARCLAAWQAGAELPAFDFTTVRPLWREVMASRRPLSLQVPEAEQRRLLPLPLAVKELHVCPLLDAKQQVQGMVALINPPDHTDQAAADALLETVAKRGTVELSRLALDDGRDRLLAMRGAGLRLARHLIGVHSATLPTTALSALVHGADLCRVVWFDLTRQAGELEVVRGPHASHRRRSPPPLASRERQRLTLGLQRWHHRFQAGDWIAGLARSLPAPEQQTLQADGVVSLCAAPVFAGPDLVGFLRLDDCQSERTWGQQELSAVMEIAEVLGAWHSAVRDQLHAD